MSIVRKPGRLRNPPKGRKYAMSAVAIVILVAIGSGAYLYTTHSYGVFPAPSTTSSSATSTSSASSSSVRSSSSSNAAATTFSNTPCSPSTATTTQGGPGTYALICTNLGLIEVQLFTSATPQTVSNFVNLAQSGFYDDLVWHRIVPGFVIQAGDPNTRNGGGDRSAWGTGTSGNNVPFEYNATLHNSVGTIAMASTAARQGGSSQFYINLADNSQSLDGNYAVFGKVINGMSVVQQIAQVATLSNQQPVNAASAYIVSITIQNSP